jgi:hypothetical protein
MSNTQLEPQLVKKRELARLLSMSPRYLDDLIARRAIPFLEISPRLHLFDVDVVKDALQARYGVPPKEARR